jgi:[ribosomal protein S5]-alanine N-acetyltransferase
MKLAGRSVLMSERLHLEPVQAHDAADFYALWSSPSLAEVAGIDPVGSVEEVASGLAQFERLRLLGMYWKWRLSLRGTGEFVGEIEAYPTRPQIHPWTEWGVGYSLMSTHWRKGYATEALQAVILAIFEHPDSKRIKADVGDANLASIRLLTKLGFQLEGRQLDKIWHSDQSHDMLLYGLTQSQWNPSRA